MSTPGDFDDRTGDVARHVAGEEEHGLRDLGGFSHGAERDFLHPGRHDLLASVEVWFANQGRRTPSIASRALVAATLVAEVDLRRGARVRP